ncbi:4-alpha-glucanotransferase [Oscillibacter valericigenes]|uniref:4-alpha-glucanotransferase n=1 Tax=Oscillibacter valericigenes TaxID=351091 RepID=UPI001F1DA57B|nr:4-alpha-glucanotransferase [Oscillibacter valericigenes]MCF2615771.1 4-alpha-glucanotransferase [Oscillibacter valericigenes]
MKRSSGILMPISSLPSPHGIGTLGAEARKFVDFLADAGQSWWQILPVGPTSYGDSPYQSFSAYAGNPYLIDLDLLCEDGLLTPAEVNAVSWGTDPARVDYSAIYNGRFPLLHLAMERGWERDADKVKAFSEENDAWLPDYALFMALKRHFGMSAWTEWPDEDIRLRRPEAVARYREELADDIRLFTYIQYLFFRQWEALRSYAHEKGIGIIGDLPIYVAMDSADVWADPRAFQLDERNVPAEVAGVPPDYFTADGQLWGNPLYDWDAMKADGYTWWIRRIAGASRLYDILRIDHFRGLESYWAVPYGETTAKVGRWVKGPGMDLMNVLTEKFPNIQFIAEDLGYLTPEVRQLLEDSGLPGMKVLQFAFDSREAANYLPHTYPRHCVCYAGTHDNSTLMGWKDEAAPADIAMAREYLGLHDEEGFNWGVLRGGQSSVADLFIAQMQDYLGLGSEARMNTPGILGGNWQWRMLPGQITDELTARIARMTSLYGRS